MKRERGFTLIELLVVIAILSVLFGLTALALNNLPTGETESMAAEKDVVQTAIDIHMTQSTGSTITAHTGAAESSKQVGPDSGDDFSGYLRRLSKYFYCWDADGEITHQHESAALCP